MFYNGAEIRDLGKTPTPPWTPPQYPRLFSPLAHSTKLNTKRSLTYAMSCSSASMLTPEAAVAQYISSRVLCDRATCDAHEDVLHRQSGSLSGALWVCGSCVGMARGGMGSDTPPLAIKGSPACLPAAAATDKVGVFQHKEAHSTSAWPPRSTMGASSRCTSPRSDAPSPTCSSWETPVASGWWQRNGMQNRPSSWWYWSNYSLNSRQE